MTYDPGPDDRLVRLLRERYAPPADEHYWASLEAEILSRTVGGDPGDWWSAIPPRWARAGLLAAGLSLAAAGLSLLATRQTEARRAFEGVMATPVAVQVRTVVDAPGDAGREATLHYLISY